MMFKRMLAAILSALLICSCAGAETLTLSMIGDCTVGDQYIYRGYQSSFTYKIGQAGLDKPFAHVAELFAADDLTLANCEGCFTDRASSGKFMSLGASPSFAAVFKLGNVDVVNLANNHTKDFGAKGLEDTKNALVAQGIGYFCDNDLYYKEIKGVKIGIVGYTYPINETKLKKYKKQIEELKANGCTFIIASAHWGKEESLKINGDQKLGGTELIDMGADLVFGHGSHTVQPVRYYNGKLIFYSLSNFTFGANAAPKDDDTVVVQVTYDIAEDGSCTASTLTAIPFKMAKDKDFCPYPIEDEAGKQQVWSKMVFSGKNDPDSGLPESFLTTGYAELGGSFLVNAE